jgi:two-component system chemotaxis response regulator CheY
VTPLSKTILTIDDSRTMRDMLMLALSNAGYRVVQAVDGVHGLEVLGAEAPDVIITDINMPRMDGFGVIENVRKDDKHRGTPILVLTTESDSTKKERARAAGATGWIVKPFNPEKLVTAIRRVAA